MNIWSPDPLSASLLVLDVNFSEVLELNLRALAHSSWSSFTFVSSKAGKDFNFSFPQLHRCSNDTAESKHGK